MGVEVAYHFEDPVSHGWRVRQPLGGLQLFHGVPEWLIRWRIYLELS